VAVKGFYDAIQALVAQRKLLAYHDRSDGGLLVTLAEMAFTGHCGVEANIATLGEDRLAALFNEELGAVIQVRAADRDAVEAFWRSTVWQTACTIWVKPCRATAS
jgi:phosphoribosylformylglycinamidine synthase